jgi:hypothetical protein
MGVVQVRPSDCLDVGHALQDLQRFALSHAVPASEGMQFDYSFDLVDVRKHFVATLIEGKPLIEFETHQFLPWAAVVRMYDREVQIPSVQQAVTLLTNLVSSYATNPAGLVLGQNTATSDVSRLIFFQTLAQL